MLALDGKLGLAPVHKPKHVLDAATGTGIWAIEYGTTPNKPLPTAYFWTSLARVQPCIMHDMAFTQIFDV